MPSTNRLEMGLSPRVRGNRSPGSEVEFLAGSIPACAGEPGAVPVGCRRLRVYPRVCGGTEAATVSSMTSLGLSPRVRGNPGQPAGFRFEQGSIPACAGEPAHRRRAGRVERVYPRVCGANLCRYVLMLVVYGSIPACAGEPPHRAPEANNRRVYPRVCGGTITLWCPAQSSMGLSPRVRGNLLHRQRHGRGEGSIPACAGEPDDAAGL